MMGAQKTRRELFVATPAIALTVASGKALADQAGPALPPSAAVPKYHWPDFIKTMDWIHPEGRQMAVKAFEAGFRLEDLRNIWLSGSPFLLFRPDDGVAVSVGPEGVY